MEQEGHARVGLKSGGSRWQMGRRKNDSARWRTSGCGCGLPVRSETCEGPTTAIGGSCHSTPRTRATAVSLKAGAAASARWTNS